MKKILKAIRYFILKIFGLHNLDIILDRVNWLQNYHFFYSDLSKSAPARGNLLLYQQAGAKLLEIIDLLCKKYKLNYWLGSGNLLGFVRHNSGPIPWDDDMDIYMLRPDYEKAIVLFKKLFEGTGFVLFFTGWYFKFMKYKNTPIGFDIFPMDQYYENIESEHDLINLRRKINKIKSFTRKDFIEASGYRVNNFHKEIWSGNINKNSNKILKMKSLTKTSWDRIVMEGNDIAHNGNILIGYERAKWPTNQFTWNYNWIYPLKRMNYLNVETNIPNNPDLYLYTQFGDYWTFPDNFIIHPHRRFKVPLEAIFSLQELININASEFVDSLN